MASTGKDLFGELDNELDIGFGADTSVDNKPKSMRETAVSTLKATSKGLLSDFEDTSKAKQLREVLSGAFPKLIGEGHASTISGITDSIDGELKTLKKDISRASSPFLTAVEKLSPNSGVGRLAQKLKKSLGIREEKEATSKSDDSVSRDFARTVFGEQKKNIDRQVILSQLQNDTTNRQTKLLLKASGETLSVISYQTGLSERYYRKSIELKYRHIIETKKLVRLNQAMFDGFSSQLRNLEHNTALPDIVKVKTNEAVFGKMKQDFSADLYKRMVHNSSWADSVKKNIKYKAGVFKDAATGMLSMAGGGLTAMADGRAMMDDFMDDDMLAEMGMTKEDLMGEQIGGAGGSAARSSLGWLLGKTFEKSKTGRKFRDGVDGIMASPADYFGNKASNSEGKASWFYRLMADLTSDGGGGVSEVSASKVNPTDPMSFDRRAHTSITSVIPTLLAKIHSQVVGIRTGKVGEELRFDHISGSFKTASSFKGKLEGEMKDTLSSNMADYQIKSLLDKLEKNSGVKLSKEERRLFGSKIHSSLSKNKFNVEYLNDNSELYRGLGDKEKAKLMTLFNEGIKTGGKKDRDKIRDINAGITDVYNTRVDVTERIQEYINDGFGPELERLGIVTYDKRGSRYIIDNTKYHKYASTVLKDLIDKDIEVKVSKRDMDVINLQKKFVSPFTNKSKKNAAAESATSSVSSKEDPLSSLYKEEGKGNISFGDFKKYAKVAKKRLPLSDYKDYKANAKQYLSIDQYKDYIAEAKGVLTPSEYRKYLREGRNLLSPDKYRDFLRSGNGIELKDFADKAFNSIYNAGDKVSEFGKLIKYQLLMRGISEYKDAGGDLSAGGIRGKINKYSSELGIDGKLSTLNEKLSDATDKVKGKKDKFDPNDEDGDGLRDNGWREQLSRLNKGKPVDPKKIEAKKGKKNNGGLLGLLGMGTGLISSVLGGIISPLTGGITSAITAGFSGLGITSLLSGVTKLTFGISKLMRLVADKTIGRGLSFLGNNKTLRKYGGKALRFGKRAGVVGAVAGLGYMAYKKFFDDDKETKRKRGKTEVFEKQHIDMFYKMKEMGIPDEEIMEELTNMGADPILVSRLQGYDPLEDMGDPSSPDDMGLAEVGGMAAAGYIGKKAYSSVFGRKKPSISFSTLDDETAFRLSKEQTVLSKKIDDTSLIRKIGGPAFAKRGSKAMMAASRFMKRIPFLGPVTGMLSAGKHIMNGNIKAATMELLSGTMNLLPIVGAIAAINSVGLAGDKDPTMMARFKKDKDKEKNDKDKDKSKKSDKDKDKDKKDRDKDKDKDRDKDKAKDKDKGIKEDRDKLKDKIKDKLGIKGKDRLELKMKQLPKFKSKTIKGLPATSERINLPALQQRSEIVIDKGYGDIIDAEILPPEVKAKAESGIKSSVKDYIKQKFGIDVGNIDIRVMADSFGRYGFILLSVVGAFYALDRLRAHENGEDPVTFAREAIELYTKLRKENLTDKQIVNKLMDEGMSKSDAMRIIKLKPAVLISRTEIMEVIKNVVGGAIFFGAVEASMNITGKGIGKKVSKAKKGSKARKAIAIGKRYKKKFPKTAKFGKGAALVAVASLIMLAFEDEEAKDSRMQTKDIIEAYTSARAKGLDDKAIVSLLTSKGLEEKTAKEVIKYDPKDLLQSPTMLDRYLEIAWANTQGLAIAEVVGSAANKAYNPLKNKTGAAISAVRNASKKAISKSQLGTKVLGVAGKTISASGKVMAAAGKFALKKVPLINAAYGTYEAGGLISEGKYKEAARSVGNTLSFGAFDAFDYIGEKIDPSAFKQGNTTTSKTALPTVTKDISKKKNDMTTVLPNGDVAFIKAGGVYTRIFHKDGSETWFFASGKSFKRSADNTTMIDITPAEAAGRVNKSYNSKTDPMTALKMQMKGYGSDNLLSKKSSSSSVALSMKGYTGNGFSGDDAASKLSREDWASYYTDRSKDRRKVREEEARKLYAAREAGTTSLTGNTLPQIDGSKYGMDIPSENMLANAGKKNPADIKAEKKEAKKSPADKIKEEIGTPKGKTETPKGKITKGERVILEKISEGESKKGSGGYDYIIGDGKFIPKDIKITTLTLAQLNKVQILLAQKTRNETFKTSGVGKYHLQKDVITEYYTKLGFTTETLFTPLVQDQLAMAYIIDKARFKDWKNERITDKQFVNYLSYLFTTLEDPLKDRKRRSPKRKIKVSFKDMRDALNQARKELKMPEDPYEKDGETRKSKSKGKATKKTTKKSKSSSPGGSSGGMVAESLKDAIKALFSFFGVDLDSQGVKEDWIGDSAPKGSRNADIKAAVKSVGGNPSISKDGLDVNKVTVASGDEAKYLTGKPLKGMKDLPKKRLIALAKDWYQSTNEKLFIKHAYRNPAENKRVGGAKGSAHLTGNAADIRYSHMDQATKIKLILMAGKYGFNGFGVGSGTLHVDTETKMGTRAWSYTKSGKWVSGVPAWAKEAVKKAQEMAANVGKIGKTKHPVLPGASADAYLKTKDNVKPTTAPVITTGPTVKPTATITPKKKSEITAENKIANLTNVWATGDKTKNKPVSVTKNQPVVPSGTKSVIDKDARLKQIAYAVRMVETNNKYATVENLNDGGGITAGAYGFTQSAGEVQKLTTMAVQAGVPGASEQQSNMNGKNPGRGWTSWFKKVGNTRPMQIIQDSLFFKDYYQPAERVGKKLGFTDPNVIANYIDHTLNAGAGGARRMARKMKGKDITSIIAARQQDYKDIVASKPSKQRFLKGWLNRIVNFNKYLKANIVVPDAGKGAGTSTSSGMSPGVKALDSLTGGLISKVQSTIEAIKQGFMDLSRAGLVIGGDPSDIADGANAAKQTALGNTGGTSVDTTNITPDKGELCGIPFKHVSLPGVKKRMGNKKIPKVKHIVMHYTDGFRVEFSTFKSKGFGTQLWIDRDGSITLVNEVDDYVWHVGGVDKITHVRNNTAIGIEIVSKHNGKQEVGGWQPMTKEQKESVVKLSTCLMKKFSLSKDDIYYHGQLTTRKKPDEGKAAAELAKGISQGGETAKSSGSGTVEEEHNAKTGEKLTGSKKENVAVTTPTTTLSNMFKDPLNIKDGVDSMKNAVSSLTTGGASDAFQQLFGKTGSKKSSAVGTQSKQQGASMKTAPMITSSRPTVTSSTSNTDIIPKELVESTIAGTKHLETISETLAQSLTIQKESLDVMKGQQSNREEKKEEPPVEQKDVHAIDLSRAGMGRNSPLNKVW